MFKFNKQVDQEQEQELEEGEISDDNLQVPPRTTPVPRVQKKTKPIPHVDQQQGSEEQYVIEEIKIRPPSPAADRKKERKQLKVEEKARHERKLRASHSPDNPAFQPPPIAQPIQPPPNPYYAYPPSNLYPYPQMPDQRQLRYMPNTQPQPVAMQYPQSPYPQRMMVPGQWHQQNPVSPNKMHTGSNLGEYGQRQQNYGYNHPPQSYPPIPLQNYPPGTNYPSSANPSMAMHSPQSLHPQNQPYYQPNYHNQQQHHQHQHQQHHQHPHQQQHQYPQQYNKNYMQQQRRRQVQQQSRARQTKERERKVYEVQRQVKQKLNESEAQTQMIKQILGITRPMVEGPEDEGSIQAIHTKLQQAKSRGRVYEILGLLQLGRVLDRLKEKELESRLVEEGKKKQAAELFKKMQKKDPRIKVS